MRKLLAVLLAVLLFAVPVQAFADTEITVNGTGETLVSADVAVISLGVMAREKDVLKAQAKVNEAIASVRAALIENGVSEEDINTDYINIYAMYDYMGGEEELTAYNANSNLAVRVTNKDIVGQIIDAAFAAGANTLNGITFSATDTTEARAASLKLAFEDAKAKAEVLAEAAGLQIIGIEEIREGNTWSYDSGVSNFSRQDVAAEKAAGTVVQAAKIAVSANITVVFDVRA
ncbi:MAG: SIMPL domain-containing protein [Oscillospiraceae bacterium]|nr:SIMPL domain-containing protein [Oscillospiraceae bacterium]